MNILKENEESMPELTKTIIQMVNQKQEKHQNTQKQKEDAMSQKAFRARGRIVIQRKQSFKFGKQRRIIQCYKCG